MDFKDLGIVETENLDIESALAEWMGGEETSIKPAAQPIQDAGAEESIITPQVTDLDESLTQQLLEDEEEPTPTPTVDSPEEPQDEDDDENEVVTLAKDLYGMGLLTKESEDEEVPSTQEELRDRLFEEKKKGANEIIANFLSRFGDDYQRAFEAIYVNGVDPQEYFSIQHNIESVKDLDLEDEENQKAVVKQLLIEDSKFSPEKASKMVAFYKESGELGAEALEAQAKLVAKEEQRIAGIEKQKQQAAYLKQQVEFQYHNNLNTTISKALSQKELGGIPVNDNLARSTFDYMTRKAYKLPNGETISEMDKDFLEMKNPENIEMALKFALLKQQNFDFSKIKQKAVTEQTNELFNRLKKKDKTNKRNTPAKVDGFKI